MPDEDLDSDGEEEDDPDLLITPSSYESLVCRACVLASPFLSLHAGTPGARMTTWAIQSNSWTVLGGAVKEDVNPKPGEHVEVIADDGTEPRQGSSDRSYGSLSTKRHLSPDDERNGSPVKRQKCETSPPSLECPPDLLNLETSTSCSRPSPNSVAQALIHKRKTRESSLMGTSTEPIGDSSECDLFLSAGFRQRWCRCSAVSAPIFLLPKISVTLLPAISVHLYLNGRKIILGTDIYLKKNPSRTSLPRIRTLVRLLIPSATI